MHDVEHAIRQPGLLQHLRQQYGHALGSRSLGFSTNVLPHASATGKHPHRHHRREVERRNPRHHPQRLPHTPAVDPRPHLLRILALQKLRDPGRELHHLQPPRRLPARIRVHLPVLARQHRGNLLQPPLEDLPKPEQHPRPPQRRLRRPGRKRPRRSLHRRVHLRIGSQRHPRLHSPTRRMKHVPKPSRRPRHAAPTQPVRNLPHRLRTLALTHHRRNQSSHRPPLPTHRSRKSTSTPARCPLTGIFKPAVHGCARSPPTRGCLRVSPAPEPPASARHG